MKKGIWMTTGEAVELGPWAGDTFLASSLDTSSWVIGGTTPYQQENVGLHLPVNTAYGVSQIESTRTIDSSVAFDVQVDFEILSLAGMTYSGLVLYNGDWTAWSMVERYFNGSVYQYRGRGNSQSTVEWTTGKNTTLGDTTGKFRMLIHENGNLYQYYWDDVGSIWEPITGRIWSNDSPLTIRLTTKNEATSTQTSNVRYTNLIVSPAISI